MNLQENKYINEELANFLKGLLTKDDYVAVSETTPYKVRTFYGILNRDMALTKGNMEAIYALIELANKNAAKALDIFATVLNNKH